MGANGAVIAGRGTYEAAGHWGGKNPWGIPFFVVTHRPADEPPGADFVFVGSLVEAIDRAEAAACEKQVHLLSTSECASRRSRRSSTTACRSEGRGS